ncbi:unnamed protein product [Calypogeia fissa]
MRERATCEFVKQLQYLSNAAEWVNFLDKEGTGRRRIHLFKASQQLMEFSYIQHRRWRELIKVLKAKERAAEPGAMMEFRKLYAAREAESSMETAREEYEEELGKGTGWTFAIMRKKGNPAKEKWVCSVREGIFHIPDKPPKNQFLNGTTSGDAAGATSRLPQQQ